MYFLFDFFIEKLSTMYFNFRSFVLWINTKKSREEKRSYNDKWKMKYMLNHRSMDVLFILFRFMCFLYSILLVVGMILRNDFFRKSNLLFICLADFKCWGNLNPQKNIDSQSTVSNSNKFIHAFLCVKFKISRGGKKLMNEMFWSMLFV